MKKISCLFLFHLALVVAGCSFIPDRDSKNRPVALKNYQNAIIGKWKVFSPKIYHKEMMTKKEYNSSPEYVQMMYWKFLENGTLLSKIEEDIYEDSNSAIRSIYKIESKLLSYKLKEKEKNKSLIKTMLNHLSDKWVTVKIYFSNYNEIFFYNIKSGETISKLIRVE